MNVLDCGGMWFCLWNYDWTNLFFLCKECYYVFWGILLAIVAIFITKHSA